MLHALSLTTQQVCKEDGLRRCDLGCDEVSTARHWNGTSVWQGKRGSKDEACMPTGLTRVALNILSSLNSMTFLLMAAATLTSFRTRRFSPSWVLLLHTVTLAGSASTGHTNNKRAELEIKLMNCFKQTLPSQSNSKLWKSDLWYWVAAMIWCFQAKISTGAATPAQAMHLLTYTEAMWLWQTHANEQTKAQSYLVLKQPHARSWLRC